jgi:outer membrane protein TolC/DNA-binding MarR family transcriptional regulator
MGFMERGTTRADGADELADLQDRLFRRFFLDSKLPREQDDLALARQEVRVLLALGAGEPRRMGEVADRLLLSVSSLTAIVDRLEAKGLVARHPAADDRRVVLIALTPDGRRRHEQRRRMRLEKARMMLAALAPDEQRQFLGLMRKIVSGAAPVLLALALLSGAAGCATARRARAAQSPARLPPGERVSAAAELGLTSNTVLTVDDAVRLALANSPAVVQAQASLVAARTRLCQARAGWLPQLSASASYRRSKSEGAPAADGYSAGLSLGDELLSFGRTRAAVRQAQADLAAAEAEWTSATNQVVHAARLAAYGLHRAAALLAVADESVQQYQRHLDQARAMAEVGTRIRYDVTKAEVDLGNARLAVLSARGALVSARAAFGQTLGLAEELPAAVAAPAAPAPRADAPEALFGRARAANPDLAALRLGVEAASAGVDAAVADLRPDLSLSASYSWSGSDFPLRHGWSLGPSLGWTLFNGWRNVSAVDAAVAQLRAARARAAGREEQLRAEMVTACSDLATARERMELAELIVRHARENLELANERYRVGMATSVELADAEAALAQARAQQVQALYDALAADAAIRRNLGE